MKFTEIISGPYFAVFSQMSVVIVIGYIMEHVCTAVFYLVNKILT